MTTWSIAFVITKSAEWHPINKSSCVALEPCGANAMPHEKIQTPKNKRTHQASAKDGRIIPKQKMKFLEVSVACREFDTQAGGRKKQRKAKEPFLQCQKAAGTLQRAEFKPC